jgi:hypothetical protein
MSELQETYVYVIAHKDDDGAFSAPVKVGITRALEGRVSTLQTGNPKPLELVFGFVAPTLDIAAALEASFHEIAKAKRLTGEWFDMSPRDALGLLYSCFYASLTLDLQDANEIAVVADYCGMTAAAALWESMEEGTVH